MARISIITPTINRQDLLPSLWDCVRGQSVQDIEWRVHDGSPQRASMFDAINDPRVFYTHEPKQMTIGAKRNALKGRSSRISTTTISTRHATSKAWYHL